MEKTIGYSAKRGRWLGHTTHRIVLWDYEEITNIEIYIYEIYFNLVTNVM